MTGRRSRSWLRGSAVAITVTGLAIASPAAYASTPRSEATHTCRLNDVAVF